MNLYATTLLAVIGLRHFIPVHFTKNYDDRTIIAFTILLESRSEGRDGMLAVANVIANRSRERKISPRKVCLQRKQFSAWNDQTALDHLLKEPNSKAHAEQWKYAFSLAGQIVTKHTLIDITNGACHYCRYDISPAWADPDKVTVRVKNHVFYRL